MSRAHPPVGTPLVPAPRATGERGRGRTADQLPPGFSCRPRARGPGLTNSHTRPSAQVPAVFLAGSPSCLGAGFGGRRAERRAHPRLRFYGYEEEAEPQRVLKSHLELAQPDSTALRKSPPVPALSSDSTALHKSPPVPALSSEVPARAEAPTLKPRLRAHRKRRSL